MDGDIKQLPFTKKATPAQMILLGLFLLAVGTTGWKIKGYFDDHTTAILAAIDAVGARDDARADKLTQRVDANSASIEAVKKYYWSNADQQSYMQAFDRANRTSEPAMIVPVVPRPSAQP